LSIKKLGDGLMPPRGRVIGINDNKNDWLSNKIWGYANDICNLALVLGEKAGNNSYSPSK